MNFNITTMLVAKIVPKILGNIFFHLINNTSLNYEYLIRISMRYKYLI